MAKITEEAMDAYANAIKGRKVKRHDISGHVTSISEVTYDDKGQAKSMKHIKTVKHEG